MRAAIVGATGEVGRELVSQLSTDQRFSSVVSVVRTPSSIVPTDVEQRVIKFDDDDALASALDGDVLFCALGTTTAKAGKQGLEAVDLDLVVRCARAAQQGGTQRAIVVSSFGANPKSFSHYSRVKGRMEVALAGLGLAAMHAVRPSLLLGDRPESRPAEAIGKAVMPLFHPLLPKRMRGIDPADVAAAMCELAVNGAAGAWAHHLPLSLNDRVSL